MKKSLSIFVATLFFLATAFHAFADTCKVANSHYTGWEFWWLAEHFGILEKHAKKHGTKIELSPPLDYIQSVNLYTAGEFNACAIANIEALTIPAFGGIESSVEIVGDFSNGNDGVVLLTDKEKAGMKDLAGKNVMLVPLSVTHYLIARGLQMNGMSEGELKFLNFESEGDIATAFADAKLGTAAGTWNPTLMKIRNLKNAELVFDSSQIPGEILDLLIIRTNASPSCKMALTGAWYETLMIASGRGKASEDAIAFMAQNAGATVAEFKAQIRTTAMFWNASDAVAFTKSEQVKKAMDMVRTFAFENGLFPGADSKDVVGISFPDGTILGDPENVKLHFDTTYMKMAARGEL